MVIGPSAAQDVVVMINLVGAYSDLRKITFLKVNEYVILNILIKYFIFILL